ncbi:hypothetical protein ACERCG_11870 [Mannheimia sp. E30BD]|uniref:hypothetical protein n=1 Tax=Mannheimia sp. E30BD TaxID=3278708 RepID=UPI00359E2EE7
MKRDNNVDGKNDYREVRALDANGRLVQQEIDLTNDGTFDLKEVYTKEADDGLVQTNFYNLVDNHDVLTKIEYYKLNENNQRTELKLDTLGDSSINAITRYDLDALGRTEKAYFDTDGNGTIERAEIYTLDGNGHISRTETDSANDGSIESVRYYERNALGQIIKEVIDSDNDSRVENIRYYQYDVYGNRTVHLDDVSGDGSINQAYYATYNHLNQKIYQIYDRTGNGITDDDRREEMIYNEFGQEVSKQIYSNVSSNPTGVYSEYNSQGLRTKASQDNDGDGQISSARDVVIEYTYGERNLSNSETRYDGTGKLLYRVEIERDDLGTAIRSFRDTGADGTINILHYGYTDNAWTRNYTDDLRQWSTELLAKVNGLPRISLSSANFKTTITLDDATLAKIAPTRNTLRITGDSTDTVNLDGFSKSETSSRSGHNQYTAEVDGTTYTVFIIDTVETILV